MSPGSARATVRRTTSSADGTTGLLRSAADPPATEVAAPGSPALSSAAFAAVTCAWRSASARPAARSRSAASSSVKARRTADARSSRGRSACQKETGGTNGVPAANSPPRSFGVTRPSTPASPPSSGANRAIWRRVRATTGAAPPGSRSAPSGVTRSACRAVRSVTVRPSGVPAVVSVSPAASSARTQRPSTTPSVPNGVCSMPGCSGSTSHRSCSSVASSSMPERRKAGRDARLCEPVAGSYSSHTCRRPCLPCRQYDVPSPMTGLLTGRTVSPACRVRPPVARPPPGNGREGATSSLRHQWEICSPVRVSTSDGRLDQ